MLTAVAGIAVAVAAGGCAGDEPVAPSSASVAQSGTATSAAAPVDDSGRSIASYFKVGDCFKESVEGATSATIVDCETPHYSEVYAVFMLPDGPFPGDGIGSEYKKKCGAEARAIVSAEAAEDASLRTNIKFPTEDSWARGDRSVTCIASSDQPRTGSIRNAA